MILLMVFHLFPNRDHYFMLFFFFLKHLKHPPALNEGCKVTLKRPHMHGVGGEMYVITKRTWCGKVCVCSFKRILIRVESSCPLPISLLSLPPPLHFLLRTERTAHIYIPSPLKSNDHQPVNNACAVPARVTVRRVLSGSIGKSAGKIRVANE